MISPRTVPPLLGHLLGSMDDDFIVAEWSDPAGPPGPPRVIAPLHRHLKDDEAWYVLEGVLCIQNGDEILELNAGAGALVKRGTPHTYWNPGSGESRYLLIMTPRIHRLIEAIHSLHDRSPENLSKVFHVHDSELL
jgi:mannose-6-phosphate isomerase-like protein (cupin superfamily)